MRSSAIKTAFASTMVAVLLGGCAAASDQYPSLAIRDAERVSGQFTPAAPDEPPTTSPQTLLQLTDLVEQARSSHNDFLAAQPGAQRLIQSSRNLGIDSDARARALVALADLTSLRGQTAIALSDIDQLKIAAETSFGATADIETAQSEVSQLLNEQDDVIDSLAAEFDR